MRLAPSLLLLPLCGALAAAQTPAPKTAATATTGAKKPVARRAGTTAASATTALPPSIPKVVGVVKPLYSLRYEDVLVGKGAVAEPQKFYTVNYTGWTAKEGTKFDSSYDHPDKQPITFPYGAHRVIPGWDTGFEGMHIGGKRRLFIPYQLAYGEQGRPPVIPAKADLIFDIELVSVSDTPPPPPPGAAPAAAPKAPSGAAAKPADAAPASSPAAKPESDPATNDPAKATTPDNTAKPAAPTAPGTTPKPPTP